MHPVYKKVASLKKYSNTILYSVRRNSFCVKVSSTMSTSATSAATIATTTRAPIQIITTQMTYYGPIVLLVVGIIGCLCNFITFTAPQLRKNSCAFYFLLSALFEFLSITFGLISRFAADHLTSTLINTDRVYCKLRAYLVSALPLIATYLVLLSSIDRCMSSSVHARLRSFSQMKIAYCASGVAVAVGFVSCVHILIGYDLRPRCGALGGVFSMYDSMFVVFWLGVIPHMLMLVFGFLTVLNIKRSKRRVAVQSRRSPVALCLQQRDQRMERQLIVVSRKYSIRKFVDDELHLLCKFSYALGFRRQITPSTSPSCFELVHYFPLNMFK